MEECLKSLSLDYLSILINGQAFSDVTFSVEGRLVHAHRCILAARSLFFRKLFCRAEPSPKGLLLHHHHAPGSPTGGVYQYSFSPRGGAPSAGSAIPVNSVTYEVFLLVLQFLYSGQVSLVPQKHEPRPNCSDLGCWHTHCTAAVDLALDTLTAAQSFGVDQLVFLTQKQLASVLEKASIEDVMKVLIFASRKQDMHPLWSTCSQLVANSGLPREMLGKHLPIDVVAKIEELRFKSSLAHRSSISHQHSLEVADTSTELENNHKIRRMRHALDSSDVELVKLMVMGEGLNLDYALALHYAVENCSREVMKALLELGAANVNYRAGPAGKTPLHVAAEKVCPDMVAVLLDHHADPTVLTVDGLTPLDILRNLASDFLFRGAIPGLSHIEPNKLRLCLELVQSAALVMSREEANSGEAGGGHPHSAIYPPMNQESNTCDANSWNCGMVDLSLDSRTASLNFGMAARFGCKILDGGEDDRRSTRSQWGSGGGIYTSYGFP